MTYKELSPLEKASECISMRANLYNDDEIKLSYNKKPSFLVILGDAEAFYNAFPSDIKFLYVFDEYCEKTLFEFYN